MPQSPKPKFTSTPSLHYVPKARKRISEVDSSINSSIEIDNSTRSLSYINKNPSNAGRQYGYSDAISRTDDDSENIDDYDGNDAGVNDDSSENEDISKDNKSTNTTQGYAIYGCLLLVFCVVLGYGAILHSDDIKDCNLDCHFETLSEKFPSQSLHTWYAIESGVNDIIKLNKPSVFIFLYEDQFEEDMNSFLNDLSRYSNCRLCTQESIIINANQLNTKENILDYGRVVHQYQSPLEQKGVMIIKDLEDLSGTVAQALHSFCDEYSPLVEKSVFYFTLKTNKTEGNDLQTAERILRDRWKDLKEDIMEPLLTRITGMVLKFLPEH